MWHLRVGTTDISDKNWLCTLSREWHAVALNQILSRQYKYQNIKNCLQISSGGIANQEYWSTSGLHKLWQPCSRAARKWRENEEMKRKWRENEEMEREIHSQDFLILCLFPPSLSISYIKNCHILSQNVKYGTFVANVTKNLTYALWGNNSGSNSLRGSSASCAGLQTHIQRQIQRQKWIKGKPKTPMMWYIF